MKKESGAGLFFAPHVKKKEEGHVTSASPLRKDFDSLSPSTQVYYRS